MCSDKLGRVEQEEWDHLISSRAKEGDTEWRCLLCSLARARRVYGVTQSRKRLKRLSSSRSSSSSGQKPGILLNTLQFPGQPHSKESLRPTVRKMSNLDTECL